MSRAEEIARLAKTHLEILSFQSQYLKATKDRLSHHFSQESRRKRQSLDPFEQVILLLLNSENQLAGANSLNIFLILMNRAERIEHRLICLHILRKNTPRSSQEKLVQSGLFGILSKWIQFYLAQDVDSDDLSGIPTLTLLCHILRECYYHDIDIAKKYDILRLIKRIAKVSSGVNTTEELQQAVHDLKTCWQEEVNKQDSVVRAALLKSKKSSEKLNKTESPRNIESTPSIDPNPATQLEESALLSKENPPSTESFSEAIEPQEPPERPMQQPLPTPPERKNLILSRPNNTISISPKQIQNAVPPTVSSRSLGGIPGKISLKPTPSNPETISEILQQAMLPKLVLIKSSDVKGILKKSSPAESGTGSKTTRRLITWNENLFDIRYFEVESTNNLNKSTARLRQEVHQKKIMITLCEWKRPDKRQFFPEDPVDVHSFEESIQRKRLLPILQKFYPDDDDIPSDPDDDPDVNEEPLRRVSGECTRIPWDHDDIPSSTPNLLPSEDETLQDFDQTSFLPEPKDPLPYQNQDRDFELPFYPSMSPAFPISSLDSYNSEKGDVCRFYNQRGGCRRGRDCQFIHGQIEKKRTVESVDISSSKRSRVGRSRSPSPPTRYGRVVSRVEFDSVPLRYKRQQMRLTSTIYASNQSPPSPPPLKNPNASHKVSTTVCSAYIGGGCRYGYKCHYLHDQVEMLGDLDDEDEAVPTPTISPNTWTKSIDRDGSVLVRMKGLPFDCTYSDILQFFTVFDVRREAIKIVLKDNKKTGEAFIKFRSTTHAIDAIRALNMKRMGKRFIELIQAEYYDADRISIL